ncbi:MAG: rod shape-determining protein MreC [Candidatus Paceibacterota bacterium]|jgi:cell shape-determining protein MreC
MKRTFLARRNALLSSTNVSWGAFLLAFAVLVLLVRIFLPNMFWFAFTPAFRAADALAAKGDLFLSSFGDAAVLTARNELLQSQNAELASENEALQKRTGTLQSLSGSGIVAGVVARPPASPYDTLTLSAGAKEGVLIGMEAFGPGGVPLGVVSAVLPDFSRVTLLSAPALVTEGWVGHSNIPLTIVGAGGGALRASLARSTGVVVGDAVFAPGPGALPVGSVVRIDSDPSSPVVTLQIQPALNLFSITMVELRATGPTFVNALSWATSTLP